jgi:hypothetical protein
MDMAEWAAFIYIYIYIYIYIKKVREKVKLRKCYAFRTSIYVCELGKGCHYSTSVAAHLGQTGEYQCSAAAQCNRL